MSKFLLFQQLKLHFVLDSWVCSWNWLLLRLQNRLATLEASRRPDETGGRVRRCFLTHILPQEWGSVKRKRKMPGGFEPRAKECQFFLRRREKNNQPPPERRARERKRVRAGDQRGKVKSGERKNPNRAISLSIFRVMERAVSFIVHPIPCACVNFCQ